MYQAKLIYSTLIDNLSHNVDMYRFDKTLDSPLPWLAFGVGMMLLSSFVYLLIGENHIERKKKKFKTKTRKKYKRRQ